MNYLNPIDTPEYSAGILVRSSWQKWRNWVRFAGLLAHTRLFSSAHKCSIGLRSGLCDGHSKVLTLLSFSLFVTNLTVCLGLLSMWKTYLYPSFDFLADVLRRCFSNVLSSWCCPFCEVHQSLLQQNSPTAWCCHLRTSQFEWCCQVFKLPPFSPECNDGPNSLILV